MNKRFKAIDTCRISGSKHLISVVNLGEQALTGVFPKNKAESPTSGPLELKWCPESSLLQLAHSYDLDEMYGLNYGYRSGLNASMVAHLSEKIKWLERRYSLSDGDVVIDVGSNDATTLKSYETRGITRIGVDPTGEKFRAYYPDEIKLIIDFFPSAEVGKILNGRKAKIITSISMFYDLEDPRKFAQEVASVLAKDGVWHLEQSYMPAMLRQNSYDTICHEHLEYYTLKNIKDILGSADLRVVDVQMNGINGGSFAVTAARNDSPIKSNDRIVEWLLGREELGGFNTIRPYREFEDRVYAHRAALRSLIETLHADGKKVLGYGASTKGNVILQFCGLTQNLIPAIAEINPDKYGSYTPGSSIPIVSADEAERMSPDYYLVLPWHFRDGIIRRETLFLNRGGKLIIPFPEIEIVGN
jgi:hypothetical protein